MSRNQSKKRASFEVGLVCAMIFCSSPNAWALLNTHLREFAPPAASQTSQKGNRTIAQRFQNLANRARVFFGYAPLVPQHLQHTHLLATEVINARKAHVAAQSATVQSQALRAYESAGRQATGGTAQVEKLKETVTYHEGIFRKHLTEVRTRLSAAQRSFDESKARKEGALQKLGKNQDDWTDNRAQILDRHQSYANRASKLRQVLSVESAAFEDHEKALEEAQSQHDFAQKYGRKLELLPAGTGRGSAPNGRPVGP